MKARRFLGVALAAVTALAISACGNPNSAAIAPTSTAVADTSAMDFTPDEAQRAAQINLNGSLDSQDLDELAGVLGRTPTSFNPPAPVGVDVAGGSTSNVHHVVRLGYVRSVSDGEYVLTLKGESTPLQVVGSDGKRDNRIAFYVNHKVVAYGLMLPKGQLMVQHLIAVPSFSFITDFFTKGRLGGVVYMTGNNQRLLAAQVTIKAATSGYLFKTTTDRQGTFSFSGLVPDSYTVSVSMAGFKGATQQGVGVLKGQKTNLMFGMTPGN